MRRALDWYILLVILAMAVLVVILSVQNVIAIVEAL